MSKMKKIYKYNFIKLVWKSKKDDIKNGCKRSNIKWNSISENNK